jgi:zinc finger protein
MIPDLELEISHGSLGGMYTTVEGLLSKIFKSLTEHHSYQTGDSKTNTHSNQADITGSKDRFQVFLEKLLSYSRGENLPFTLQLHDPFGNSFISAPLGSLLGLEDDHNLQLKDFIRSEEEVSSLFMLLSLLL